MNQTIYFVFVVAHVLSTFGEMYLRGKAGEAIDFYTIGVFAVFTGIVGVFESFTVGGNIFNIVGSVFTSFIDMIFAFWRFFLLTDYGSVWAQGTGWEFVRLIIAGSGAIALWRIAQSVFPGLIAGIGNTGRGLLRLIPGIG